jgi:hypothetical protein
MTIHFVGAVGQLICLHALAVDGGGARGVQPTVSKLGITFDSVLANSIMTEERGVAVKLLYTLKTTLDRITKQMHGSKNAGAFAHTLVRGASLAPVCYSRVG